jgi:hypothetical protein
MGVLVAVYKAEMNSSRVKRKEWKLEMGTRLNREKQG